MKISRVITLFLVLSLTCLSFNPLTAYALSPFAGLELSNSLQPPGAKVFAVARDSLAFTASLQKDDVITSIEGQNVTSLDDFVRISLELKDRKGVSLSINRGGKILNIVIGTKAQPEAQPQTEPPGGTKTNHTVPDAPAINTTVAFHPSTAFWVLPRKHCCEAHPISFPSAS